MNRQIALIDETRHLQTSTVTSEQVRQRKAKDFCQLSSGQWQAMCGQSILFLFIDNCSSPTVSLWHVSEMFILLKFYYFYYYYCVCWHSGARTKVIRLYWPLSEGYKWSRWERTISTGSSTHFFWTEKEKESKQPETRQSAAPSCQSVDRRLPAR